MKKFICQKAYHLLLILSNRFPSRRLVAWKIMVGTSLLVVSTGCKPSRQNSPQSDNAVQETLPSSTKELPEDETFCYVPSFHNEDTLQSEKQKIPPPPAPVIPTNIEELHIVSCYDMVIEEPDDFTCYLPPKLYNYPEKEINKDSVYDIVESMPEFSGGNLLQYLKKQMVYPPDFPELGVEGRVIVRIIIERDGSVSNPVLIRGLHPSLDSIALQLVGQLPKWKPGIQGKDSARVYYTLPIHFRISHYMEQQEINTQE